MSYDQIYDILKECKSKSDLRRCAVALIDNDSDYTDVIDVVIEVSQSMFSKKIQLRLMQLSDDL